MKNETDRRVAVDRYLALLRRAELDPCLGMRFWARPFVNGHGRRCNRRPHRMPLFQVKRAAQAYTRMDREVGDRCVPRTKYLQWLETAP
jgi:hypothetical protein